MKTREVAESAAARWRHGAEETTADTLEWLLAGSGVHLLHDRRMPGGGPNIDHVAVGPQGVTVIDIKRWPGKVRVRNGRLWVAGRDRTGLVDKVRRQVGVIRLGLGMSPDVPVVGAICWTEAGALPLLRKLRLDGVLIDGPRRLAEEIRRPGPVPPAGAQLVARLLDARLPRAG